MKSDIPPEGPPEPLRRDEAVEPRVLDTTLPDEVAREDGPPPFVDDPDMSLKRLVVPRVAPMLDGVELDVVEDGVVELSVLLLPLLLDVLLLDVLLLDVLLVLLLDELVLGLEELELPLELENVRYRSLRLPRSCGAMMLANLSAWMVPATRIVRRRSPTVMAAVRVTTADLDAVDGWDRVFQKTAAATMTRISPKSQSPALPRLGGEGRTISGTG